MNLKHEVIMNEHPEIAAWLKDRPLETQKAFAKDLIEFCTKAQISPEAWRQLDKFQARDLAWKVVEPLKSKQSPKAIRMLAALKSWFRNYNGELLPLDSQRGGKHSIRMVAKKATYEHKPSKSDAYQLIDLAGNMRDRALTFFLFFSGVRKNVIRKVTYALVKGKLDQDIIPLKITWDMDSKLKGAGIPFYYTFIEGEAVTALRQYCEVFHKDSSPETPLFYSKRSKKPLYASAIWKIVVKLAFRAGFTAEIDDPECPGKKKLVNTVWVHSFRKAFRKVVRQADVADDDDKEQLMGHALKAVREAYYDQHDVKLIQACYMKCNFAREAPASETTRLQKQLEDERFMRRKVEERMADLEKKVAYLDDPKVVEVLERLARKKD